MGENADESAPLHARRRVLGPDSGLRREIIPPDPLHSVRVLTHDFPSEICGWGFHPEYEIHLITKTQGSFIAGDYVGTFSPGHVSMLGPDLPHDWVSDIGPDEVARDRDAVVQFSDDWVRRTQQVVPELLDLNDLLSRSTRGLVFTGETGAFAEELIREIVTLEGTALVARVLELLSVMARAPDSDWQMVASEWLGRPDGEGDRAAVDAGLAYIFENLTGDIRLSVAAKLAYMSEPTFSKYFKRATGLTFSNLVKKLRIAHARRLLDATDDPISRIASLSGYNNIANFNRQFLAEVGVTPTQYRRLELADKPRQDVVSLGIRAGDAAADAQRESRIGTT